VRKLLGNDWVKRLPLPFTFTPFVSDVYSHFYFVIEFLHIKVKQDFLRLPFSVQIFAKFRVITKQTAAMVYYNSAVG